MTAISTEVRTAHEYTRNGVTVIVSDVPTEIVHDDANAEHRLYSMGVAMRLEQLIEAAFKADSTPGTIHRLRF
jgi:hypothetical protein